MNRQKWAFIIVLGALMCFGLGVTIVSAGMELTPAGDAFVIAAPSEPESQAFPDIRSSMLCYHDVAVAGDGSLVATWVFSKEGVTTDYSSVNHFENPYPFPVYARRFAADGEPLSEVIEVTADAPETLTRNVNARVASDAAGNFVVCWAKYSGNDEASQYVYARLFNADGTARSDAFQVSGARSHHEEPAVAMNAGGSFVVAWRGDETDDQERQDRPVLARRFSGEGTALDSTPTQVNSTGGNIETWSAPSLDINDKGQFAIGWSDQRILTNWWWQVRWLMQKFNAAGKPSGSTKVVYRRYGTMDTNFTPVQRFIGWNTTPSIAVNNSGEFSASWIPNWYNFDDGPYYRFYRPSGIAIGWASSLKEARIGTKRVANALNEDGTLIMAWKGNAIDCQGDTIYIAHTSSNASDIPEIVQPGGCTNSSIMLSDPAMDGNADGKIAVIWHDGQQLFGRVYK